jgi:hypothetical protein
MPEIPVNVNNPALTVLFTPLFFGVVTFRHAPPDSRRFLVKFCSLAYDGPQFLV